MWMVLQLKNKVKDITPVDQLIRSWTSMILGPFWLRIWFYDFMSLNWKEHSSDVKLQLNLNLHMYLSSSNYVFSWNNVWLVIICQLHNYKIDISAIWFIAVSLASKVFRLLFAKVCFLHDLTHAMHIQVSKGNN